MFAPLHHVPTGGPWSFGVRGSYRAATGSLDPEGHDEAVRELVRRSIECFGPLGERDIAQFTILRAPVVSAALASMSDELVEHESPSGGVVFDTTAGSIPAEETPAPPRLLGMWDSTLLAFADRKRVIPDPWRSHVIRRNGDVLPAVLVDGYVVGVWRMVDAAVEVFAFRELESADWAALADEAEGLRAFVADRDPNVYSRYRHWFDKGIPSVDSRTL
jgi:hypothetical protein